MIRMTPEQSEALHTTHKVNAVGGHTVGAPDGGPGLPGVGWSTLHGDLRAAHFFGLHGLPDHSFHRMAFALRKRRLPNSFVFSIAGSYLALIGILMWQALRGQSIIDPDAATLTALGLWLGASALAILLTWGISAPERARAAAR